MACLGRTAPSLPSPPGPAPLLVERGASIAPRAGERTSLAAHGVQLERFEEACPCGLGGGQGRLPAGRELHQLGRGDELDGSRLSVVQKVDESLKAAWRLLGRSK